jgi:hypothetical protein
LDILGRSVWSTRLGSILLAWFRVSISDAEVLVRMLADLNFFFGLNFRLVVGCRMGLQ